MAEQLWRSSDGCAAGVPGSLWTSRGWLVPVAAGALLIEDREAAVERIVEEYLLLEKDWRYENYPPDTKKGMARLLRAAAGGDV